MENVGPVAEDWVPGTGKAGLKKLVERAELERVGVPQAWRDLKFMAGAVRSCGG